MDIFEKLRGITKKSSNNDTLFDESPDAVAFTNNPSDNISFDKSSSDNIPSVKAHFNKGSSEIISPENILVKSISLENTSSAKEVADSVCADTDCEDGADKNPSEPDKTSDAADTGISHMMPETENEFDNDCQCQNEVSDEDEMETLRRELKEAREEMRRREHEYYALRLLAGEGLSPELCSMVCCGSEEETRQRVELLKSTMREEVKKLRREIGTPAPAAAKSFSLSDAAVRDMPLSRLQEIMKA